MHIIEAEFRFTMMTGHHPDTYGGLEPLWHIFHCTVPPVPGSLFLTVFRPASNANLNTCASPGILYVAYMTDMVAHDRASIKSLGMTDMVAAPDSGLWHEGRDYP